MHNVDCVTNIMRWYYLCMKYNNIVSSLYFFFMDPIKQLWTYLKTLKPLYRAIVLILAAALAFIVSMSMSACGQTVKVTVRDTPSGVSISTTQSKQDSSGTNISINPNINFK